MTRHERRKAAKRRRNDKLERLAKAELGRQQDERATLVANNLANPRRPERTVHGLISTVYRGPMAARASGRYVSHKHY